MAGEERLPLQAQPGNKLPHHIGGEPIGRVVRLRRAVPGRIVIKDVPAHQHFVAGQDLMPDQEKEDGDGNRKQQGQVAPTGGQQRRSPEIHIAANSILGKLCRLFRLLAIGSDAWSPASLASSALTWRSACSTPVRRWSAWTDSPISTRDA